LAKKALILSAIILGIGREYRKGNYAGGIASDGRTVGITIDRREARKAATRGQSFLQSDTGELRGLVRGPIEAVVSFATA
jgi:hypothetical protein